MLRIAKLLGLGLFLSALSWNASSADTASFQVSLTIQESCLVQSQDEAGKPVQPQVSCLHDSPSLTKPMTPPAPSKIVAPSEATSMIWLVMF